jgi:aspartate carbamoyltransferase catalytic subunit
MTTAERETIVDLIDLTIADSQLISTLRRQVSALVAIVREFHPALEHKYLAELTDESSGPTRESLLEAAQKLAPGRDLFRSKVSSTELGETIRELAEDR